MGLKRIAQSNDGNFELQAFQCPFNRWSASNNVPSIYAGFAVKDKDQLFTIIGKEVEVWSLDKTKKTLNDMPKLKATNNVVEWESKDECFSFKSDEYETTASSIGHFINMRVEIVDALAHTEAGVCASREGEATLIKSESLFPDNKLDAICTACTKWVDDYIQQHTDADLQDLCNICNWQNDERCKSRRLNETESTAEPEPEVDESAETACQGNAEWIADSKTACETVNEDEKAYEDCRLDWCNTKVGGGDAADLQTVVDGEKEGLKDEKEVIEKRAADKAALSSAKETNLEIASAIALLAGACLMN